MVGVLQQIVRARRSLQPRAEHEHPHTGPPPGLNA